MEKLTKQAPELVDMRKQVNVSLDKAGIADTTAKVALCIDRSGSMMDLYQSGAVQAVAEKTLALASAFDDDGDIDMFTFGTTCKNLGTLDLTNYQGGIDRLFKHEGWGSTDYAAAIRTVRKHYEDEGSKFPAYVLFVTDGAPDSSAQADHELNAAEKVNIFWQFVGIGPGMNIGKRNFPYLSGVRMPHTGFIAVGAEAKRGTTTKKGFLGRHKETASSSIQLSLPDNELFDALIQSGYARWLGMSH